MDEAAAALVEIRELIDECCPKCGTPGKELSERHFAHDTGEVIILRRRECYCGGTWGKKEERIPGRHFWTLKEDGPCPSSSISS